MTTEFYNTIVCKMRKTVNDDYTTLHLVTELQVVTTVIKLSNTIYAY